MLLRARGEDARVPAASLGPGQGRYAVVVVPTGGDGGELGCGGGTKGLPGEVGEYLTGGLAGGTPFLDGVQKILVEIDSDTHVSTSFHIRLRGCG